MIVSSGDLVQSRKMMEMSGVLMGQGKEVVHELGNMMLNKECGGGTEGS